MPRFVDHDARRREVTEIARHLVVQRGRAALTVRNVAAAAGCSSTVVSHYFTDMDELFHATYDAAAQRSAQRTKAVEARDATDIRGLVEAVLPLDAERSDDWRVWFAFWSEALTSPAWAAEQRARALATLQRFERCLGALTAQGRLHQGLDVATAAARLAALVPGLAAEAIFDPTRWTPDRQRMVLDSELALIGLA